MIDILFGESAAGGLKCGKSICPQLGEGDVMPLDLAFSMGEIDEDDLGPKRRDALMRLMSVYPTIAEEVVDEYLENGRKYLVEILTRAKDGEPLRIWGGRAPDEAAGLCWLMSHLRLQGLDKLDVTLVELPVFMEREDGTVVQYTGWGEVDPEDFGRFAQRGQKLPRNYMSALAFTWGRLREEDLPLRAMVNGQLVSVPEDFYDSFILSELALQEEEFVEAQLVGGVLGKYQLGIGDGLVALRVEKMIEDGLLVPTSTAQRGDPTYWRTLKKTEKLLNR